MRVGTALALGATLGSSLAQEIYLGFNSGSTTDQKKTKKQADFEKEFQTAQSLNGAPDVFNSVRLYTNIQDGTTDTPIEAFPAAIKTKTKLLLGIWASGTTSIDKELSTLVKAIDQYGKEFTDLVVGLSVGSEDLYRVSEPGLRNKAGVGQDAKSIVKFLQDARKKLKGTSLGSIPIGHVDTWTAWVNESNQDVIKEADFLGTNLFPYYENTKSNDISNAADLFKDAISQTEKAAGGKDIWITETGWPVTGPDFGDAKATTDNAKKYWQTVGCSLFGKRNTFWYVLQDSNPDNEAKFGLTKDFSTTPRYNLSCPAIVDTPTPTNNNTNNSPSGSPTSIPSNGNSTTNGTQSSPSSSPPPEGAGSVASVSVVNACAIALSMVFAVATWAI